ncbi:YbaB/EbfC family nucleoid-associated protein [Lentzea rhizosphaerae]|uniref:YbaB/EbfC family nucleoid-associated protein n=1 Tax=Lentzea rhizosphaerae TaxID=2041025 RepID=A0ABV8BTQ6_9PSEU
MDASGLEAVMSDGTNWQLQIAENAQHYRDLNHRLSQLRITETSRDGAVRVTVATSGLLTSLVLTESPGPMSRAQLAAQIMECIRRAQSKIPDLEHDNMNTLNRRLSDAKEQLAEVKGNKEVWTQVPPDSGVSADKLPKMMSDWRNNPWGRTPEQWHDYDGIDVTFRDPTGKVLGRCDTGTGLPKPQ